MLCYISGLRRYRSYWHPSYLSSKQNTPRQQIPPIVNREERNSRGIITFKWVFKISDIMEIEAIWSVEKDEIATWQFTETSRETGREANETLIRM